MTAFGHLGDAIPSKIPIDPGPNIVVDDWNLGRKLFNQSDGNLRSKSNVETDPDNKLILLLNALVDAWKVNCQKAQIIYWFFPNI